MIALKLTNEFAQSRELPSSFVETASQFYFPLAESLAQQAKAVSAPILVGINGCQGSGKSTLTDYLLFILESHFGLPSVGLSIDDFYLTLTERRQLASRIHPLFQTRGVPGTHDIQLLNTTLHDLSSGTPPVFIPRFNKATDDRFEKDKWTQVDVPPKIVILEGWCVGIPAQTDAELVTPINELEHNEDSTGHWRRYSNLALGGDYQTLFNKLDRLILLKAPGFYTVKAWRLQQEERLRQKVMLEGGSLKGVMSEKKIERFIQHYQRLTEQSLKYLPFVADDVFTLDENRHVKGLTTKEVDSL